MNKNITLIGVIIALPVIVGVSFFVRQNIVSVQTSPPETFLITTDTNITYSYNTAFLTDDIK